MANIPIMSIIMDAGSGTAAFTKLPKPLCCGGSKVGPPKLEVEGVDNAVEIGVSREVGGRASVFRQIV